MSYAAKLLIFCWVVFLPGKRDTDSMESFKWVIGEWQMERKSGLLVESWQQVNDSSFEGKSFMIQKDGQKKILEEMQIVYGQKGYHFISAVPGQNKEQPVSFKITSFSSDKFIAENPDHDFPRRISYELIGLDSLHAWIDGGPANPDQKVDFYFSRKKQ